MSTLLAKERNNMLIWIQDNEVGLVGMGDCEATIGDCDTRILKLYEIEGYVRRFASGRCAVSSERS